MACLAGIVVFSRCNGDGTLWKTDAPQTNARVAQEGHCPLPWAPDSKNVQYVNYAGADGHVVQLARFEGPVVSLRSFASKWFVKRIGPSGATARGTPAPAAKFDPTLAATLAKQAASGIAAEARVTWFDTDKIEHGEIYGGPGADKALFLIDTDRSVLYFWLVN